MNKKREIPMQFIVGLLILLLGGGFLFFEFVVVKWYPVYKQQVEERTLAPAPYKNDSLGIEMQVAAGIYGRVDTFPGGVKIYRPKFMSIGPSLIVTVQPNPDQSFEFTPQILAKWQSAGVQEEIFRYNFDHTQIEGRDAALVWQLKDRLMYVTAHIMSPERIVQADCTPGKADEALFLKACEQTLRSIKVAGPMPPQPEQGIIELNPPHKTKAIR